MAIDKLKRAKIYIRDGYRCTYCGITEREGAELTLDHVKAIARGGGNDSSNLVTCCRQCNQSKGCMKLNKWKPSVAGKAKPKTGTTNKHGIKYL